MGDVEAILEGIMNKRILEEKMEKFNKLSIDEQVNARALPESRKKPKKDITSKDTNN